MAKTVKEREDTKFIRELRKENSRLKKEVRQLRKSISRINRDGYDEDEEEDFEPIPVKEEPEKPKCPKCGFSKDIYVFVLRDIDYYKCENCNSKGRLK